MRDYKKILVIIIFVSVLFFAAALLFSGILPDKGSLLILSILPYVSLGFLLRLIPAPKTTNTTKAVIAWLSAFFILALIIIWSLIVQFNIFEEICSGEGCIGEFVYIINALIQFIMALCFLIGGFSNKAENLYK